jgi:hypothetical protein
MAHLVVTGITEIISVTENAATILRPRNITCATEVITIGANCGVHRDRVVPGITEAITLISPVSVIWAGGQDYLVDSVVVGDQLAQSQFNSLNDIVEIGDALGIESTTSPLADSVTVLATLDQDSTVYQDHLIDYAVVQDYGQAVFYDEIIETVRVSETIDQAFVEHVQDSVTVLDELEQHRTVLDILVDSIEALDNVGATFSDTLNETVSIQENLFDNTSVGDIVIDSLDASDYLRDEFSGAFADSLLDTVTVFDTLAHGPSSFVDELLETVTVIDALYARDPNALAWVMNVETGAPSFYDNFEFTSMIEYKGLLLGSSAEGLFLLGRSGDDADAGVKVQSELVTGLLDWNSTYLKRLRDVYLGYTGGQLELDIETYNQPVPKYTYYLVERDADAPRNNRIRPGRGLKSRFWRFTLRNVSGKWHQVYDISANVDISNRRL